MKKPSIINKFWSSFDTSVKGFSARKASAFFAVQVSGLITFLKVPEKDQIYALCAWLLFGLLCLGLVTFDQIIKLKNGGSDTQPGKPQDENSASHIS